MRTFGTCTFKDGTWALDVEPHVAVRLKRVFGRIAQGKRGTLTLTANPENSRELEWFMARFPLNVTGRNGSPERTGTFILNEQARAFDAAAERTLRILAGEYEGADVEMSLPPRPYQKMEADLCLNGGALLVGDVIGLGKTVSGLTMLAHATARPGLVVAQAHLACPKGQWEREAKRFLGGLHVHTLKRSDPYELPRVDGREPDVLITSYHKLRGWRDFLAGRIRGIVFDEIQELRRGGESFKGAAAAHIAGMAMYRMGLSATPIFNLGGEFYNVLEVLSPGCLGTRYEFVTEWCNESRGYGGRDKVALKEPEAFGTYLRERGLLVRHTRADVDRELDHETQHVVQEIESRAEALRAAESNALELAQRIVSQRTGFDVMTASAELSNILRHATGVDKAPWVARFVQMLVQEQGESVVLFGWHREVYDVWNRMLADLKPAMYTGSESPAKKRSEVARFMSGDTDVLIISLRSGQGIDGLQERSATAVIGELDWSPAVLAQCVGRVARDGQRRKVYAYYLVSRFGSDPVMMDTCGVKEWQLKGVNDPAGRELPKQVDPGHVKRLAERVVAKGSLRGAL